jgi:hypothetical protein
MKTEMRKFGLSTGAVARGDFVKGLEVATEVANYINSAVELSALRGSELKPLLEALPNLNLSPFRYVSIHAPSKFDPSKEREIVESLMTETRDYNVIVHPDVIRDPSIWVGLGSRLCLENMDNRKKNLNDAHDLERVFSLFPDAGFCFDLGHAYQVDSSLGAAEEMITQFRSRLRQVHLSDVDKNGVHGPLSLDSIWDFRQRGIGRKIPEGVPVIIESVLPDNATVRDWVTELEVSYLALRVPHVAEKVMTGSEEVTESYAMLRQIH